MMNRKSTFLANMPLSDAYCCRTDQSYSPLLFHVLCHPFKLACIRHPCLFYKLSVDKK
jgi:hypothetical protein